VTIAFDRRSIIPAQAGISSRMDDLS